MSGKKVVPGTREAELRELERQVNGLLKDLRDEKRLAEEATRRMEAERGLLGTLVDRVETVIKTDLVQIAQSRLDLIVAEFMAHVEMVQTREVENVRAAYRSLADMLAGKASEGKGTDPLQDFINHFEIPAIALRFDDIEGLAPVGGKEGGALGLVIRGKAFPEGFQENLLAHKRTHGGTVIDLTHVLGLR